jgi:hypothetical protein
MSAHDTVSSAVSLLDATDAADAAYERAQEAAYAWHVAEAERSPDADSRHAVYHAAWLEYLRLVNVMLAQWREGRGV